MPPANQYNLSCIVHPSLAVDESYHYNSLIAEGVILKNVTMYITKPLKLPKIGGWRMAFCDIHMQGKFQSNWFTDEFGDDIVGPIGKITDKIYSCVIYYDNEPPLWINKASDYHEPLWLQ